MKIINKGEFTGERALYNTVDAEISESRFFDGESPLKESKNIAVNNCTFEWKYPLWYCTNVKVKNTTWLETARSGIWYTNNIEINDCNIIAPKQFRRCSKIILNNCIFPNALETMWSCKDIKITNCKICGDYFGMNSENIYIINIKLDGNYCFDGGKNIEIHNSVLNSKDSFWNCENVVVYDSKIIGEYIGWNSKNITLINCTIESDQGFCYIKNLKLKNCKLINTTLCFELCENIDAEIDSTIDSVKNPISGRIVAKGIKELILDEKYIDKNKTIIEVKE